MENQLDYIQRLLDLMRETFPTERGPFKRFFYGDPEQIALFDLPCVIVDASPEQVARDGMGEDEVTENLVVKLVFNKADDWDGEVHDKDTTLYRIRQAIGTKNLATGKYPEGTVKYALRNSATKGLTAIANDITVDYTPVLRSGGEKPVVTAEAQITVPVRYLVEVDEFDPEEQM